MLLKKALEKLQENKEFKNYTNKHKESFLSHAFTMVDKVQGSWQIGYCNPKTDKVIVFEIDKEIDVKPEEDIFKKPGQKVKPLDLSKVKLNLEQVMKITNDLVEKNHSAEIVNKTIVILQNLGKNLYNLTLVCQSFNIINIRIDATSGEILLETKQSIMGLRKE
jgi:hypothetical protein